eukprot:2882078-Rhodomonas_salina.3
MSFASPASSPPNTRSDSTSTVLRGGYKRLVLTMYGAKAPGTDNLHRATRSQSTSKRWSRSNATSGEPARTCSSLGLGC